MEGIIPIITVLFFVPSVVYGHMTGVYHGEKDVCNAMGRAMGTMSSLHRSDLCGSTVY